jgi:8-oxo-dGTP diphosphatase
MKDRKDKSRVPILAAGGIVVRNDRGPQFAVVQLRKLGAWGLPKGKLAVGEDAMTAARREVLEETGHRVTIHEFLGTLAYEASGRPKVVQFWRMHPMGEPVSGLMRDVKAVHWLALEDAIDRLTHLRERVFLEQVGPIALKQLAGQSLGRATIPGRRTGKNLVWTGMQSAARMEADGTDAPLAPVGSEQGDDMQPVTFGYDFSPSMAPSADALMPGGLSGPAGPIQAMETVSQSPTEKTLTERALIRKTWGWFRHAAILHRQPLD